MPYGNSYSDIQSAELAQAAQSQQQRQFALSTLLNALQNRQSRGREDLNRSDRLKDRADYMNFLREDLEYKRGREEQIGIRQAEQDARREQAMLDEEARAIREQNIMAEAVARNWNAQQRAAVGDMVPQNTPEYRAAEEAAKPGWFARGAAAALPMVPLVDSIDSLTGRNLRRWLESPDQGTLEKGRTDAMQAIEDRIRAFISQPRRAGELDHIQIDPRLGTARPVLMPVPRVDEGVAPAQVAPGQPGFNGSPSVRFTPGGATNAATGQPLPQAGGGQLMVDPVTGAVWSFDGKTYTRVR
jgi:hypothetical protein